MGIWEFGGPATNQRIRNPELCLKLRSTHSSTMTTATCELPSPSNPLHVAIDWADILASCRAAHGRSPPLAFDAIHDEFLVHLPAVAAVIEEFCATLRFQGDNASSDADADDGDSTKDTERKGQILAVRNSLRFAMSCLSLRSLQAQAHDGGDARGGSSTGNQSQSVSIRCQIQEEAVVNCNLHQALARALQYRDMDSKSQLLAARLLSNLVTGNNVTSQMVLRNIAPSSTEAYRTKQLLASMSLSGTRSDAVADTEVGPTIEYNWVDMIQCAARAGGIGRETLAAIVAALFNAIVAIQDDGGSSLPLFASMSSNKTFICACVRHILSADTIKPDDSKKDEQDSGTSDDATEWITLFLTKLSCYGHFSSMYEATGILRDKATNMSGGDDSPAVTPEQIVLLHCIASALDEWTTDTSATAMDCPLGGASGQQTMIKSCQFLANQTKLLRQTIKGVDCSAEAYAGERTCRLIAYLSMLEILGTMLSSDDANKAKDHVFCRINLGKETSLLSDVIIELGMLVDELSVANRGVKARELKIDDHDQRLAVACVRLIGNICYKCPSNQDKVRKTEVPFAGGVPDHQAPDGTVVVRCGLHVLLSCTSFSYGCFTLREWALIAIRNVLEGNQQNQDMVAQLEAQKTVDTPELNKMGVKTVIDDQGNVRVEPRG